MCIDSTGTLRRLLSAPLLSAVEQYWVSSKLSWACAGSVYLSTKTARARRSVRLRQSPAFYNFTRVSLLISSFSYLCTLNVFTLACCQCSQLSQPLNWVYVCSLQIIHNKSAYQFCIFDFCSAAKDNEVENQPEHWTLFLFYIDLQIYLKVSQIFSLLPIYLKFVHFK